MSNKVKEKKEDNKEVLIEKKKKSLIYLMLWMAFFLVGYLYILKLENDRKIEAKDRKALENIVEKLDIHEYNFEFYKNEEMVYNGFCDNKCEIVIDGKKYLIDDDKEYLLEEDHSLIPMDENIIEKEYYLGYILGNIDKVIEVDGTIYFNTNYFNGNIFLEDNVITINLDKDGIKYKLCYILI